MKKTNSVSKFAPLILASAFGLFLLYGTLSSSDFPRGTTGCPYHTTDDDLWNSYDSLNVNFAQHHKRAWYDLTLNDWLRELGERNLKVILEKAWHSSNSAYDDTLPYWVKYYGYGQWDVLEVEYNESYADSHLIDSKGATYYYFFHDDVAEISGFLGPECVRCLKDSIPTGLDTTGMFVRGCRYTQTDKRFWEPRLDVDRDNSNPDGYFGFYEYGRDFLCRFRAAIDNSGGVSDDDTVLVFDTPFYWDYGDDYLICHNYKYVTKGEFVGDQNFVIFENETHADSNYLYMKYCFITTNLCDVYVDWVEFMDMEQGYPLWSDALRPITLDTIENECKYLVDLAESYNSEIIGFEIGDIPRKGTFRCLGILNDSLFALDDTLRDRPPRIRVAAHNTQATLLRYFDVANPGIYDPYLYPFAWENSPGNQSELDSLSELLEDSYQKSRAEGIPMVFKLQAHDLDSLVASGNDKRLRNPIRSELFAESYMALAHGAKGISFFK